MTLIYAYVKEGYSAEQIRSLVANLKNAANEGLNIPECCSMVAIKELDKGEYSDNLGVMLLTYTEKGQGFDMKKRFAKMVNEGVVSALDEPGEVKLIIKEQANDMSALNGLLNCNRK